MQLLLSFLFLALFTGLALCLVLAGALALSVHWIERSLAQSSHAPVLTRFQGAAPYQLQGDPLWGVSERLDSLAQPVKG